MAMFGGTVVQPCTTHVFICSIFSTAIDSYPKPSQVGDVSHLCSILSLTKPYKNHSSLVESVTIIAEGHRFIINLAEGNPIHSPFQPRQDMRSLKSKLRAKKKCDKWSIYFTYGSFLGHGGTPSYNPSHGWPWLSIETQVIIRRDEWTPLRCNHVSVYLFDGWVYR